MKKIAVTKILFTSRAVSIRYIHDGVCRETILYRRSDHSWQPDPDTRAKGERFMEALQKEVFKALTPVPEKKTVKRRPRDTWFAE